MKNFILYGCGWIAIACAVSTALISAHEDTRAGKICGDTDSVAQTIEDQNIITDIESLNEVLRVPLASKPGHALASEMSYTVESDEALTVESLMEPEKPIPDGAFEVGEFVSIPTDLPTNVKLATDYRCYNLTGTPHWRLQQRAWTDEYGLRRFNEDYIVGMGTYYSIDIGDRFEVTYDTGKVMTVILGDNKPDIVTDPTHRYQPVVYWDVQGASVLEFIADLEMAPNDVWTYGTYDSLDEFKGNIVSIRYLGRDTSADWDTYF